MSQERWDAVDKYISDRLAPPDEILDGALRASAAAGLPPINVAPNQGKLLSLYARMIGARRILEIGTLGGYNTIWLGWALPLGGRIVTLEADPRHAATARANIAAAGLADAVEVRVGRALDLLPELAAEGPAAFDLFFIDADKANIPAYFEWALKLSRAGSVIIVDNVVRGGKILDAASEDENVRGVRRFYDLLAAETRVSATAVQTVGVKGHDGFALAVVTG